MKKNWQIDSWQKKIIKQDIHYPDESLLQKTLAELAILPPLVSTFEIDELKKQLAKAGRGECFILQGGDCAESFNECRAEVIADKFKILLQMSLILIHGLRKPVIRIGRIAGQYAKPRSEMNETQNSITLPSYRGDIVNSPEFNEAARISDPLRMKQAYFYSALTLNYLRALIEGGFTNLEHPEYWNLNFAISSPLANRYQAIAESIRNSLEFLQVISGVKMQALTRIDYFFTSHEALHLLYEQALTRKQQDGKWYNVATHLPWIGMRTAFVDSAHIEYASGIENPIAIKVGASMSVTDLVTLIKTLNPNNEEGKLVLIHRFGVEQIQHYLPQFLTAITKEKLNVVWSCDPMHGNTSITTHGVKTRRFEDILSELQQAFVIHQQHNTPLGGVHFEMTGENVTECIGGAAGLTEHDLKDAYKTLCDPRLNYEQSLEMAMLIASCLLPTDLNLR